MLFARATSRGNVDPEYAVAAHRIDPPASGTVVFDAAGNRSLSRHEAACQQALARQLAVLQGMTFGGNYDPLRHPAGSLYFVPADVLVASAAAARGIRNERDLFGGVVAHPIMASKAITHPLVDPEALRPAHWSEAFAERVAAVTLPGHAAFTLEDARRAGRRLLASGPVRVKPADANAGRDQQVAATPAGLDAILDRLDDERLARSGLVLETNLSEVTTYSVGHVRVGKLDIAYYGTQRLTRDNAGAAVYGGSDLHVRQGDLQDLLQLALPEPIRIAVSQAHAYDAAARHCFPAMFASRRNYDIAQGTDAHGQRRSGVLEPSWRIGGASGAEVAALRHFQAQPHSTWLHASTIERYGDGVEPPAQATVLFRGIDPQVGAITKYTVVDADGHA